MRPFVLVGPILTALLFGACSDDSAKSAEPGATDAGLSDVSALDVSRETSTSNDAALADAAMDAANTDAAIVDSAVNDSTANDSAADAADATDSSVDAAGASLNGLLDKNSGANTFGGGLNAANFVASGNAITANAGVEWFGSGNGNASGSFNGLSFKQDLGGVVENKPYTVSFYVSQPDPGQTGIALADFSKLRIGGPNGTMVWSSTVTPTTEDVWVKWTGTYTPVAGDVGGPFYFEATFNLAAKHSVGFDGPITAVP